MSDIMYNVMALQIDLKNEQAFKNLNSSFSLSTVPNKRGLRTCINVASLFFFNDDLSNKISFKRGK